jgi:hypothetical protein
LAAGQVGDDVRKLLFDFHPSVFLIPRFLYNRGLPRIFRRNPHA